MCIKRTEEPPQDEA